MAFTKVSRRKAKLRLALTGVSGSGKTLGALLIASGITGGDWEKIALIDTEHERARFYADRSDLGVGEFLYQPLQAPFSPERYMAMVAEGAQAVGPDGVVIIDSLSHAWNTEGGILNLKDNIAAQAGKNSYTAWNEAGRKQSELVNTILAVNCHTIVTMRSKMEYALELNDRGKQQPVKLGLAPVQRDDTEYEFDIVLNIDRNHVATASKDVTFLDRYGAIITPELGRELQSWLAQGVEPARCEMCGGAIMGVGRLSAEEIIAAAVKNTERKLCLNCCRQWTTVRQARETEIAALLAAQGLNVDALHQATQGLLESGELTHKILADMTDVEYNALKSVLAA